MQIFLSQRFPVKVPKQPTRWINRPNWAIELPNGEVLYGAHTKQQLEQFSKTNDWWR